MAGFIQAREAGVLTQNNNPSKETVACLSHFFVALARQDRITDKQFDVLFRAQFEKEQERKNRHDGPKPIYDDSLATLTRKKRELMARIRTSGNPNKICAEELLADFEYLLNKETDAGGKGDQRFLKLVQRLGFDTEFYTGTLKKRALARLNALERERAKRNASMTGIQEDIDEKIFSESEINEEIRRMQVAENITDPLASPARELLFNPIQSPDPNRPILKLLFKEDGHVSFEYPLPGAPVPVGVLVPAVVPQVVQEHTRQIQRAEAARGTAANAAYLGGGAVAAQVKHLKDNKDSKEQAEIAPAALPKDHRSNAFIFGTGYDVRSTPRPGEFQYGAFAKPSPMQAIKNGLMLLYSIFTMIFKALTDAKVNMDNVEKSVKANPYRKLEGTELTKLPNADFFDTYRMKLPEKTRQDSLIVEWRNAADAVGVSETQRKANCKQVLEHLKDALAEDGLYDDLQSLNFNLCVRSLPSTSPKSRLLSLWSEGPNQRKEALALLCKEMYDAGAGKHLTPDADELLRTLENMTKNSSLLAQPEMREVRESYAALINEFHKDPRVSHYKFRAQLLKTLTEQDKEFAKVDQGYNRVLSEVRECDGVCREKLNAISNADQTLRKLNQDKKKNDEQIKYWENQRDTHDKELKEARKKLVAAQQQLEVSKNLREDSLEQVAEQLKVLNHMLPKSAKPSDVSAAASSAVSTMTSAGIAASNSGADIKLTSEQGAMLAQLEAAWKSDNDSAMPPIATSVASSIATTTANPLTATGLTTMMTPGYNASLTAASASASSSAATSNPWTTAFKFQ